jgi:hypothetical protein
MSETNDYYESKKSEFLIEFKGFNESICDLIIEKYGKEFNDSIREEIKREYESLYEEIPYIGGDSNRLTYILFIAIENLVFYNVLKRHGKSLEDIGELIYKTSENFYVNHPEVIPSMKDPNYIHLIKMSANKSQEKEYPDDWVYKFIEGDDNCDYGIDYTECGIVKLYHQHNADELTPYICAMDGITSEIGNQGLIRTETIAEGFNKCNFRYKLGNETKINSIIKNNNKKLKFES